MTFVYAFRYPLSVENVLVIRWRIRQNMAPIFAFGRVCMRKYRCAWLLAEAFFLLFEWDAANSI